MRPGHRAGSHISIVIEISPGSVASLIGGCVFIVGDAPGRTDFNKQLFFQSLQYFFYYFERQLRPLSNFTTKSEIDHIDIFQDKLLKQTLFKPRIFNAVGVGWNKLLLDLTGLYLLNHLHSLALKRVVPLILCQTCQKSKRLTEIKAAALCL